MRRTLSIAIVLGLAGAALLLAPPRIAAQRGARFERDTVNGRDVVAREVLVKFRQRPQASDLAQIRADGDADDVRSIGHAGVFRLRSRSRNVADLLASLRRRPDVLYAEPNFVVRMISEPNDPQFPQLWALKNIGQVFEGLAGVPGADIHAVPAWNITLGSTANVVAVVDTGIDYTHPDLAGNMWSAPTAYTVTIDGMPITCAAGTHGFNAITRTCDPMDDQDHGSHVSGTIGATGDNGTGIVGINWTTRLMAIRFIDATGNGTTEDAIAAVEFAIAVKQRFAATGEANIRVLSNSWGGPDFSQALLDEVNAANDADMLFVAGAGNDGSDNGDFPFYPASFDAPNVVSVAATDNTDELAWFSNYGASTVHLGAPGVDILSTTVGNRYKYLSGTSMATPHVSGAAALVLSACNMDTATLKETLLGTAESLPTLEGLTTTGGRLDVYSALLSCTALPQTPSGLTARGDDTRVMLKWSSALGAIRYNVKRSPTPGGPYVVIAPGVHGTTYTDTGLTNGTTYYYVVSASNALGESADSNEASATANIPPDLVVASFVAPTTAGAGATISISVTIRNQGAGTAAPSTTKFYWSDDPVLDGSDSLLDSISIPQLLPGAQNATSLSILIPASSVGRRYIIAQADADDVLSESIETNNGVYRSLLIGPDLTISSFTVPGNGGADSTIVVNDTIKNQGGGGAPATVTRFYLSANSALDTGDTPLGSRSVWALDAGASSAGSTTVTIPVSTPPGTYYIVAKTDADDAVTETMETNNTSARTIVIGGDLVISSLTVPAKGNAGSVISVTDTTGNSGGGTASASVTRFYLSTNTLLDAADTPLAGSHSVPDLASGAADTASTSLTLPAIPPGTYYVIARADDDNAVVESRETNNTLARTIAIGGDLAVTSFTAPASGGGGSPLTVTDSTTNQGGGPIAASTTRFYLSVDGTVDGTDPLLGSRAIGALDAGATSSGSTTLTIPPSTAPGTYYVVAKADADGALVETSETNNTATRSIVIGSDLVVSALTVPAKSGPGATITVSDTTTNSGGGVAAPSVTRFYLSANSILDGTDTLLAGAHAVPDLGPGQAQSASTSLVVPASANGTYYIIARADDGNAVAESKETNNTLARSIVIGSDLAVAAFTVPVQGGAGLPLTVSDTTANQGGGPIGATTTRFYLSADGGLDGGDTPVGSRPVPALAAGAVSTASTTITIPSGTATGTYYVIAKSDGDDAFAETSETNNTASRSVRIGGDLAVQALTAPAKAAAGAAISVSDTAVNQGGGAVAASLTVFYLSTSSTGGPADILLDGNRVVPQLAPGTASTGSTSLTVPAGTTPGTYYILAVADANNAVSETIETNNIRSRTISIGPDLSFTSLMLSPTNPAAGANLTVTDTITNQGGDVAAPSTTRFYLSTNTFLDGGDIPLNAWRAVPQLAAAGSNSGSTILTIPSGTAPGSYYVLIQADSDGVVPESVETNNLSVVRGIQVIAGP